MPPGHLTLRIVLLEPTPGVLFGLQRGRGRDYETTQKQTSRPKVDLTFEFAVTVKPKRAGAAPALGGPFVQGPAQGRFVYIDIGTYAGQNDTPWSRRLKVPLTGITWNLIESAAVLETRVPGTGRDGGPSCATVKPFPGWVARPS